MLPAHQASAGFSPRALTPEESAAVSDALRGYPADPKFRGPYTKWLENVVRTRTLPDDAITCTNVGVKREVAIGFAADAFSTANPVGFITGLIPGTPGAVATAGAGVATGILAGSALPVVGAVIGVLGFIFGRHKQKVAEERAILCDAVPAAQEALKQIDIKYQSGEWTHTEVNTVLDTLLREFNAATQKITKDGGGKCNAACGYRRALAAIVQIRKRVDYLPRPASVVELAAAAGSPPALSAGAVAAGIGLALWLASEVFS